MESLGEWTVPALTFLSVMALGGAVITARAAHRRTVRARLLEGGGYDVSAAGASAHPPLLGLLHQLGLLVAPRGASTRLKEQLAHAGYFGASATGIFLGLKLTLFLLSLLGLGILVLPMQTTPASKLLLVVAGAAVLSFVPNALLAGRRRSRCAMIRNHLPDAVDLLEVCVSSGMGLDMAWNSVTDEIRHVSPVLADEMSLTNLESHLGASRAAAMRHMAERTGADELASLAALLIQSSRFGTSISDALRVFAQSMRESRRQRAEEVAEKMAVKLLFPLVLFVFPPILIVTVGPAGIKITQIFGGG